MVAHLTDLEGRVYWEACGQSPFGGERFQFGRSPRNAIKAKIFFFDKDNQ